MKQSIFIIILLFLCIKSNSQIDILGYYISSNLKNEYFLSLKTDSSYTISYYIDENVDYSYSDILMSHVRFEGEFSLKNDTIFLCVVNKNTIFRLKIFSTDILKIIDYIPGFKSNELLYCSQKLFQSGRVKYGGKWKDGKRHGCWLFYEDNNKFIPIVRKYNYGEIIEEHLFDIEKDTIDPCWKNVSSQ